VCCYIGFCIIIRYRFGAYLEPNPLFVLSLSETISAYGDSIDIYIERQSCMPKEVHFVSDANLGALPSCLYCLLAFYAICITLYRTFMQLLSRLLYGYSGLPMPASSHANYSICQRTKTNYSSILKLSSGTSSSFSMPFLLFPSFLF
jgi:hypothetical protein